MNPIIPSVEDNSPGIRSATFPSSESTIDMRTIIVMIKKNFLLSVLDASKPERRFN